MYFLCSFRVCADTILIFMEEIYESSIHRTLFLMQKQGILFLRENRVAKVLTYLII